MTAIGGGVKCVKLAVGVRGWRPSWRRRIIAALEIVFDNQLIQTYELGMKNKVAAPVADDQSTVTRLLDAAERLFGEHGYDGVGMRMLAAEAKVNLGAATYHFGSKKELYLETFMRRFRPNNEARLRQLRGAEAQAKGRPLPVEKIVECLLRVPFESGLKHPSFQRLLARNMFMPPPFIHGAISKELLPGIQVFNAALKRSLPEVPEDLLHWRSSFAIGSLLMVAFNAKDFPEMKNAALQECMLSEMIRFAAAGLRSPPAVRAAGRPSLPTLLFPPQK